MIEKIHKSDQEWREQLAPEQYHVLREQGTEKPFCNAYWDEHGKGTFYCMACGQALFTSGAKFDSGTGWPSFFQPIDPSRLETREDTSRDRIRTEVICARCDSHLGHVFEDGPAPTGLRYCMNAAALRFEPDEEALE